MSGGRSASVGRVVLDFRFTVRRDPRVLANVREEERPPKQDLRIISGTKEDFVVYQVVRHYVHIDQI